MKLSSHKQRTRPIAILAGTLMLSLGLSPQAEAAAIVSFTDDGTSLTITGSGTFDPTGLPFFGEIPSPYSGVDFAFLSAGTFSSFNPNEIWGGTANATTPSKLVTYWNLHPLPSFGWTPPSGFSETADAVGAGSFFVNPHLGLGGFAGAFSFDVVGTLSDFGFAENESLVMTNHHNGDTLTLITGASVLPPDPGPMPSIPEPSGVLPLGALLGLGLLFRTRR